MDDRDLDDRRSHRERQVERILTFGGEGTPIRQIRHQPDHHFDVEDHGQDRFALVKDFPVCWAGLVASCSLKDEGG